MNKNVTITEINERLVNKKYWLNTCINKMPRLSPDQKSLMYNHLTILRNHINALENMLNIAKRDGEVKRDMIYWED